MELMFQYFAMSKPFDGPRCLIKAILEHKWSILVVKFGYPTPQNLLFPRKKNKK